MMDTSRLFTTPTWSSTQAMRCLTVSAEAIAERYEVAERHRQADALPRIIDDVYRADVGSVDPTHPATAVILGVLFRDSDSLGDYQDLLIAAEFAVLDYGLPPLIEVTGCAEPAPGWRRTVASRMPVLPEDAAVSARLPFLNALAELAVLVPVSSPEAVALQALRDIAAQPAIYDNHDVDACASELVEYLHEQQATQSAEKGQTA